MPKYILYEHIKSDILDETCTLIQKKPQNKIHQYPLAVSLKCIVCRVHQVSSGVWPDVMSL